MGLFDFLDTRVGIARWAAKWFRDGQSRGWSAKTIVQAALDKRYEMFSLKPSETVLLESERDDCFDIFDLCHLIARLELLNHLSPIETLTLTVQGRNICDYTFGVIDRELYRLGFAPKPRPQQDASASPPPPPKSRTSVDEDDFRITTCRECQAEVRIPIGGAPHRVTCSNCKHSWIPQLGARGNDVEHHLASSLSIHDFLEMPAPLTSLQLEELRALAQKYQSPIDPDLVERRRQQAIRRSGSEDSLVDPIEEDPRLAEAFATVNAVIEQARRAWGSRRGSCHLFWHLQRMLLREAFGIEWFPPTLMNPTAHYD